MELWYLSFSNGASFSFSNSSTPCASTKSGRCLRGLTEFFKDEAELREPLLWSSLPASSLGAAQLSQRYCLSRM
jgi:hypothetical protein